MKSSPFNQSQHHVLATELAHVHRDLAAIGLEVETRYGASHPLARALERAGVELAGAAQAATSQRRIDRQQRGVGLEPMPCGERQTRAGRVDAIGLGIRALEQADAAKGDRAQKPGAGNSFLGDG